MNYLKTMKSKVQNDNAEDLLKNFVCKDIQAMLRPLNLLQSFIFCPKYCIRDNFITPNSVLSNVASVFGAVVFIVASYYRYYFVHSTGNIAQYPIAMILIIFDFIFYTTGFIINVIITIIQTESHVEFVLLIQDVHNFLNVKKDFRNFICRNRLWVFFLYLFYMFNICFGFTVIDEIFVVCCLIVLIAFDANIVYAIRLIKLLQNKLTLWNIEALTSEKTADVYFCNNLFQTYSKILKCYKICEVTFKVLILYHVIESFVHILLYIKIFLDSVTSNNNFMSDQQVSNVSKAIMLYVWLVKNLVLQILLPLQCESFYDSVDRTQDTCKLILGSKCSDQEKKLYKNIQRLHEATFSKMSVCRLFYIHAVLPLQLVDILTQHMIVLLQFAIL